MTNLFTFLTLSSEDGPRMDRESTGHDSFVSGKFFTLFFCLLFVGVGSAWGTAPTLSDLSFSTENSVRIVNEDFESLSTTSAITTSAVVATTDQTAFGAFNCIYNNKSYNSRAIVSNANGFSTKSMALSSGGGSPVIMHITTPTWGTKGAFRIKTTKTSTEYIGFYAETSGNIFTKLKSAVYLQNNAGTISIHNGLDNSGAWVPVGTYTSTDIIDICVIYNTTNSSATYGNSITLASKTAHIYINGACVMDGDSPKAFSLGVTTLTSFRVAPLASSGNKAYVDDVQIWNALPTAAASCSGDADMSDATASLKGSFLLSHLLRTCSLPAVYLKGTYPAQLIYTTYISRDFEILNCCQLSSIVDQISLFWIILGHF